MASSRLMPVAVIAWLEGAVRRGQLASTLDVLLDALEADRLLGPATGLARARALVREIVRSGETTWRLYPTSIGGDFHARLGGVEAFESLRGRCESELDARGPWLKALGLTTRSGAVAELLGGPRFRLEGTGLTPVFTSDFEVELELDEYGWSRYEPQAAAQPGCWRWRWHEGELEPVLDWAGPRPKVFPDRDVIP